MVVSRLRLWERICRFVAFEPVGKRVTIRVDDTSDPALSDFYDHPTMGVIHSTVEEHLVFGFEQHPQQRRLCAIVHLDSPLGVSGGNIHWLLAVPRHLGYGLDSLCLTFIAVNVVFLEGPDLSHESRLDLAAICSMKLIR